MDEDLTDRENRIENRQTWCPSLSSRTVNRRRRRKRRRSTPGGVKEADKMPAFHARSPVTYHSKVTAVNGSNAIARVCVELRDWTAKYQETRRHDRRHGKPPDKVEDKCKSS